MEAFRSSPQDATETPCPSCGAPISTASIGRRRRVQCPKCRAVVELRAPAKTAPPLAPAAPAELWDPAGKIAALEARIAALEDAAKTAATAKPLEIVVQRPERKWKWLAHSDRHDAEKMPTNIAEVFLQNLRNYDGQTITIQIANNDPHVLARAMGLKEVFDRADWTVIGPGEITPRNAESGLFLAIGSLPLPPAAAAAYFAMTTSGFALESFLDPKLGADETILIVA